MAPSNNNTNTLNIHEITKISPSSSTSTSSSTAVPLPLTFFDTFWFKFLPVERLFFYQLTESTSSSPRYFQSVILPNLKRSLSLTLFHYPLLAGNLIWPLTATKPAIYYSPNDGVSLTVAESTADFNSLTGNHEVHQAVEFHPLVPELFASDDKAELISIQITYFPNQGFSIGISCHHAILDGKSTTMFMKSWAYICKLVSSENYDEENYSSLSLPEELTPFFDRTVIKDPTGIDMVYVNNWLDFTGSSSDPKKRSLKIMPHKGRDLSDFVRATFVLKREDIKKLRDKISEKGVDESKSLHLSTFVVTLAYVFVCIVKSNGGESDRNILIGFVADYRRRLDPPVLSNYFGNCVWWVGVAAKAEDLTQENGVVLVAEKLSDLIKGLDNKDSLDEAKERLANIVKVIGKYQALGVAGSTRFEVYRSDFGWGRPKKVEIVSIDKTEAISMAESRDESGGVEVGVVLKKKEMETFASLYAEGLH